MSDSNTVSFRSFEQEILYFNGMYKLPVSPYPSTFRVIAHQKANSTITNDKYALGQRLHDFKKIITEEIAEVDDIVMSLQLGFQCKDGKQIEPAIPYTEIEFLTDMADWLGDIQVYCASEMAKFGLPVRDVLKIIMQSNFSKQGADGRPSYDEHGKVQKGPGYWKPEPQIKAMLVERITDLKPVANPLAKGIVWRNNENE